MKMNRKLHVLVLAVSLVALPALAKAKKPVKAAPEVAAPVAPPREDLKHVPDNRGHAQPEVKPTIAPQKFIESLYERLSALSKSTPTLDTLHAKMGDELKQIIDYPEMAKLALGQKWAEIDEAQKKEFVDLLTKMVQNSYVRRFKPGQTVEIKYGAAPKLLPDDRVQVATTLTVGKTSAEVHYALRPSQGRWWVYDIVVDDASQVQTYRKNFKNILDKEGWPGLMTRMKKAAEKKA